MICNSNSMPMAFPILHARLLLLFVLPSWPLVFSQANREIHLGSSLVASDNSSPWRSPSGEFAFGFYQLGNQNLFLLAIWFDKIPEKTLAWYANGDNPAPEGSKVELTSDGQLILNDPKGDEIWRPQTTLNGVTHAYMLDAGNFALVNGDQNSTHVWESFKNPADTVLPTQVLEIGGTVSSRQAESNYSKGRFQLRLLPNGNLVLNTFDLQTNTAYDAYYWSNTYDAANRSNSGERVIFDESGRLYVVLQSGENVILKSGSAESTGGYYYRATLDFDGVFRIYTRSKLQNNGSWVQSWHVPKDICSEIRGELGGGSCGFNSYCVYDKNGRPTCECLPGFFPVDPDNKLDGCKHNLTQKCEAGGSNPEDLYQKREVSNLFWPYSANFEKKDSLNEDVCWKSCLYDCNCVVAVHNEGTCWKKKMPLSNGRANWSIHGKTMIKVPKYDASSGMPPLQDPIRGKKKDQGTLILVGSILLGSSVFLNFLLAALISLVRSSSSQKRHKLIRSSSILETNIRSFTYEELKQATDGFREELGRGAFGTVYKGVLSSSSSEI
ncbi:G-type lectin S-receptor-like serine/threonine-protein kinase LECRK3 [Vitis vinifera]|nr:G-type lectin S-receptor-like serine/threonine-protein kinase LECRK3 [Vitis vinifera]